MRLIAPWSPEVVELLRARQNDETMHPYTCGVDHHGKRELVPEPDGLHCEVCGFHQNWCHDPRKPQ